MKKLGNILKKEDKEANQIGYLNLINATVEMAALDLRKSYRKLLNTPSYENYVSYRVLEKYFIDYECNNFVSKDMSQYIFYKVREEVEKGFIKPEIDTIKRIYKLR